MEQFPSSPLSQHPSQHPTDPHPDPYKESKESWDIEERDSEDQTQENAEAAQEPLYVVLE